MASGTFYCFIAQGRGLGGGLGLSFGGATGASVADRARSLMMRYPDSAGMRLVVVSASEWSGRAETSDNGGMFTSSFSVSDNAGAIKNYLARQGGLSSAAAQAAAEVAKALNLQSVNPGTGEFMVGVPVPDAAPGAPVQQQPFVATQPAVTPDPTGRLDTSGARKFLVWSIINTILLGFFIFPIFAIVQSVRAQKSTTPEEYEKHKKLAKWFNIAPYGLYAVIILISIVFGLVVGAMNANKTASSNNAYSSSALAGMPLSLQSHGNTYVLESFTVSTGTDGNTVVTITGSGFGAMPIVNGNNIIPIYCTFDSIDGREFAFLDASIKSTTTSFHFGTSATPKTVTFFPEDNRSDKHTFNWK